MAIGFKALATSLKRVGNRLAVLVPLLAFSGTADAVNVTVVGLTQGKAILVVNGAKPKTLSEGQTGPDGVKLISANSEAAVLEIDGKRRTLGMGQGISTAFQGSSRPKVVLIATEGGHYVTTGTINGSSVRFMVDTGATAVALGSSDARRLGIQYWKGEPMYVSTANGTANAYRVKFDNVRVGDISLNNVEGLVLESDMAGALLGMSFLGRLELKHEGEKLTMTQRY